MAYYSQGNRRPSKYMTKNAIIVDMDGTLVDVSEIKHYITDEPANYEKFHLESINCDEHVDIANAVRAWGKSDVRILIVTARSEKYLQETIKWLNEHNIKFDMLYMRKNNDDRYDSQVKSDILNMIYKQYVPILAYDDNPHTIKVWQRNSIPVVNGPGW